jgi:radical SAM-linked protein
MTYAGPQQRLRIKYTKAGPLTYISHLDLNRTWERVFRRAALPLAYSRGYTPRPRFQIAAALPVGVTGRAELTDVWLDETCAPDTVQARLQTVAPEGLGISAVQEVELRGPSLQSQMRAAEYCIVVHTPEPVAALQARVETLLVADTLPRLRYHKGKMRSYDLRPLIYEAGVKNGSEDSRTLTLCLQLSPQGAGRPDEVIDALGLSAARHRIERTRLFYEQEPAGT